SFPGSLRGLSRLPADLGGDGDHQLARADSRRPAQPRSLRLPFRHEIRRRQGEAAAKGGAHGTPPVARLHSAGGTSPPASNVRVMETTAITAVYTPVNYLAVREVAHAFRVSPHTIYRLVGRNELPAFKVGGQIRIPREGVEDYVRKQLQ